jgi:hypothetical protein
VFGFLHASGEQLILEGIDAGSRQHALALLGPACGAQLRELVLAFAGENSPGITIDYFASAANAVVERYASWTVDPGAELIDAFSSRSWNHGTCVCGQCHRETGFFFPPGGLEDRVVRRAKSDGARGVFLVPTNRKAAYYMCLVQNAHARQVIDQRLTGFVHASRPMTQHTLFAVDFGERADRTSPSACGQALRRRSTGREARRIETEERVALSHNIAALAGSLLA